MLEPTVPNASARTGTPFAPLRLPVAVAAAWAAVALGVGAFGPGRWLAVHVFTLGVLSTLVIAMSDHFAGTLLHRRDRGGRAASARLALVSVGAATVLFGLPAGVPVAVAAGATTLSAAVLWLYLDLRRARRAALAPRFAFVVRGYERACGAFLHGALLGALVGTGVLPGTWSGAARLAHVHVMVLGWGGLVLLATLVFFGPTVLRARIVEGADEAAAKALSQAATALAVATVALLATGTGGTPGLVARLVAAAALAVYAVAAARVCTDVRRAAARGRSAEGTLLRAACVWLPAAALADAAVVASGQLRLLDAVGVVLLVGVLGQAVLGALGYLAPQLAGGRRRAPGRPAEAGTDTNTGAGADAARGAAADSRRARRDRLAVGGLLRPVALNTGVALVAGTAVAGAAAAGPGAILSRAGWLLVAGTIVATAVLAAPLPHRRPR